MLELDHLNRLFKYLSFKNVNYPLKKIRSLASLKLSPD